MTKFPGCVSDFATFQIPRLQQTRYTVVPLISDVYQLIYYFHLLYFFFFLYHSCSDLNNLILNLSIQLLCVISCNILTGTLDSVKSNANSITVLFLNNIWKLEKFNFDHTFPYSVTVVYNLISSIFFNCLLNGFPFFKIINFYSFSSLLARVNK